MNDSAILGSGKLSSLLAKFAVPCIFSLIISCLYNIADQIFVGQGIGYEANAATGVVFPITVIGWGISLFFGDGGAAMLSMKMGENDRKSLPAIVGSTVMAILITGLVLIALCYLGGTGLLTVIGATEATLPMAWSYGVIIFAMMPLAMVQNGLASIIRADGSPEYAMGAMIVGAVINLIGDPLTIFIFHWGIQGAAIATIAGQFVSFLLCIGYLFRAKNFRLSWPSFLPKWHSLTGVMMLGTSSLITQLSIVVITILNNILLVHYGALSAYGSDIPLAAFVVLMKLFQIVLNIAIGLAAGAQPIVGYNYGSGKWDRVTHLFWLVMAWTFGLSLVCTMAFEFFPLFFVQLFGASSELYVEFACNCLRIYLCLLPLTCVQKGCAIFLQSIGHGKSSAFLAVLRDGLLIVFTLVVPMFLGLEGIFWAAPCADVIAFALTIPVMQTSLKKLKGDARVPVTQPAA